MIGGSGRAKPVGQRQARRGFYADDPADKVVPWGCSGAREIFAGAVAFLRFDLYEAGTITTVSTGSVK